MRDKKKLLEFLIDNQNRIIELLSLRLDTAHERIEMLKERIEILETKQGGL